MSDTNNVTIVGRLTKDSEIKYTANQFPVTKFSIAVNGYKENVSFFDVELLGKLGESLNQYLLKGKQIAVTGELKQERWEHDGMPKSKIAIIASSVQLL